MKIHISDSTRQLLDTFGKFLVEKRGLINIKVTILVILQITSYKSMICIFSCLFLDPYHADTFVLKTLSAYHVHMHSRIL